MDSYIGKAVRFQHRVATGKAGLKSGDKGQREHIPVPTTLVTNDALVLSQHAAEGEAEPRLFLIYAKKDTPVLGSDWQSAITVAFDVPHREHKDAANELFWWDELDETRQIVSNQSERITELANKYDASTEGVDETLQAMVDKTRHLESGGTLVNGEILPSAADLDAAVKGQETADATAGKKVRVIRGSKA